MGRVWRSKWELDKLIGKEVKSLERSGGTHWEEFRLNFTDGSCLVVCAETTEEMFFDVDLFEWDEERRKE